MAKSSLSVLVRVLGRELIRDGIVLSAITPGAFVDTGNAMDRLSKSNPEAYQEFLKNRLPRGKMGSVDEIIPLLDFLLSENSGMMAGSNIVMDAGESRSFSF